MSRANDAADLAAVRELADQMDAAEAMQNQEEVWWAAHQRERHDRVVTEERARQVTLRCGLA